MAKEESMHPYRLFEKLDNSNNANPFFFIPNIGFIYAYSPDLFTQKVTLGYDQNANNARRMLDDYRGLKKHVSPMSAFTHTTGKPHEEMMGWLEEQTKLASLPIDWNDYLASRGIFGKEGNVFTFYIGMHPHIFTESYKLSLAIRLLYATQRNDPVTIIDFRNLQQVSYETLSGFIDEQVGDTVAVVPVKKYFLTEQNSINELVQVVGSEFGIKYSPQRIRSTTDISGERAGRLGRHL